MGMKHFRGRRSLRSLFSTNQLQSSKETSRGYGVVVADRPHIADIFPAECKDISTDAVLRHVMRSLQAGSEQKGPVVLFAPTLRLALGNSSPVAQLCRLYSAGVHYLLKVVSARSRGCGTFTDCIPAAVADWRCPCRCPRRPGKPPGATPSRWLLPAGTAPDRAWPSCNPRRRRVCRNGLKFLAS